MAARTARSLLIRRLPDEDGKLVTYLPASEIVRLLGMGATTLNRWMTTGAVRTTNALAGARSVAVADCARIRRMTAAQKMASGLELTPAEILKNQRDWHANKQLATLPAANHQGEEWDSYDLCLVITMVENGKTYESIAKALGRSYAAVADCIARLRVSGDLPAAEEDGEWWTRTRALLTDDEVVAVEQPR